MKKETKNRGYLLIVNRIKESAKLTILIENEFGYVVLDSILNNLIYDTRIDIDTSEWDDGIHHLLLLEENNLIFQTLLYKYIGQHHLTINIPVASKFP